MKTKQIHGVSPRANDNEILSTLAKEATDGGGKTMVIGIRNEAGQIYRKVEAVGMGEFIGITSALWDLDMVDELKDAWGMRDGCDAIFK